MGFIRARAAGVLAAAALALPAHAQLLVKSYAQQLVDQAVAQNPGLLVVAMHVTPPRAAENVIIASNIGRIGKPGDEGDLRVIDTGKPSVEVTRAGNFEVELPMRDVAGETLGALGLVWRYRAGDDKAALEKKSEAIRDALARRILNAANLMDPFPFERLATTRTRAQKLVDELQAKHAELTVLALRAPQQGAADLVVLGSTFGRHGKRADADDMKIFDAAQPATGIFSNGKRFGADLQLHDRSGKKIGTMNVGYAYREGDDREALLARALALRDELQQRIESADKLAELDP